MSEPNVSDQFIELVTRFFPEWIESAEDHITKVLSQDGSMKPEELFAEFITQAFREHKGAVYDSVAEKNREVADYLIAVNSGELSDEEIRWQLMDKLGGVD